MFGRPETQKSSGALLFLESFDSCLAVGALSPVEQRSYRASPQRRLSGVLLLRFRIRPTFLRNDPSRRGFLYAGRWGRIGPDQLPETAREIPRQRPVKARSEVGEQLKQGFQCGTVEVIGFNVLVGNHTGAGGRVFKERHFSADLAWPDRYAFKS